MSDAPFTDKASFDAWLVRTFHDTRASAERVAPSDSVIARVRIVGDADGGFEQTLVAYYVADSEEAAKRILGWLEFGMSVMNGSSMPSGKPRIRRDAKRRAAARPATDDRSGASDSERGG